jgi:hypothetical protein
MEQTTKPGTKLKVGTIFSAELKTNVWKAVQNVIIDSSEHWCWCDDMLHHDTTCYQYQDCDVYRNIVVTGFQELTIE